MDTSKKVREHFQENVQQNVSSLSVRGHSQRDEDIRIEDIEMVELAKPNDLGTLNHAQNEEYLDLIRTISKRAGFDSVLGLSNNFLI